MLIINCFYFIQFNPSEMDLLPWSLTFFASLLISLEVGILSGVCVSVIFLLYYAARPSVKVKKAEVTTIIRSIEVLRIHFNNAFLLET
jgi:MFS superfamily sulfate permease-like transporter